MYICRLNPIVLCFLLIWLLCFPMSHTHTLTLIHTKLNLFFARRNKFRFIRSLSFFLPLFLFLSLLFAFFMCSLLFFCCAVSFLLFLIFRVYCTISFLPCIYYTKNKFSVDGELFYFIFILFLKLLSMRLLLYCYFLCWKFSKTKKKSIQNVEAKLHGIFMYLLRIFFSQHTHTHTYTQNTGKIAASDNEILKQCTPLLTKSNESKSKIQESKQTRDDGEFIVQSSITM